VIYQAAVTGGQEANLVTDYVLKVTLEQCPLMVQRTVQDI